MKPDLSVAIGDLKLKNPVITASGTFGCGEEYQDLIDLELLGAITVKAVTINPVSGNPPPRIVEVTGGMLNSIGLQNEGVDNFINNKLPVIREYGVPIIVNIAGSSVKEYKELAERLDKVPEVSALEINISCPNVKEGGMQFGIDRRWISTVTKNVCRVTDKTVITKLSPNVTDIVEMAQAAMAAGSDAVSLVNTFKGMAVDPETGKPKLATVTGGLSGPCIKPIALRMVWEVAARLGAPVIGMGGIATVEDTLEFLIAGATAVGIGTANFTDPRTAGNIVNGLEEYLRRRQMTTIRQMIGTIKCNQNE